MKAISLNCNRIGESGDLKVLKAFHKLSTTEKLDFIDTWIRELRILSAETIKEYKKAK